MSTESTATQPQFKHYPSECYVECSPEIRPDHWIELTNPFAPRPSKPYKEHLRERLQSREEIIGYLAAVLEDGDAEVIKLAVGDVIDALTCPDAPGEQAFTREAYLRHGMGAVEHEQAAPVDMLLFCPRCHTQHIDAPDERTLDWKNPPHKTHLCHGCEHLFRPSDQPTNGVATIASKTLEDAGFASIVKPARSAAEGEAEKAALLPCPWCRGTVEREDEWGSIIVHKADCYFGGASIELRVDNSERDAWNRRALVDPSALSSTECARVFRQLKYDGCDEWVGKQGSGGYVYSKRGIQSKALGDAQIIAAYYLEHGLVREEESG